MVQLNVQVHSTASTSVKPKLVSHYLRGQRVVDEDVGSCLVGPKGPDGPGCEEIPVVLGLEELTNLLPMESNRKWYSSGHVTKTGSAYRFL